MEQINLSDLDWATKQFSEQEQYWKASAKRERAEECRIFFYYVGLMLFKALAISAIILSVAFGVYLVWRL